MIKTEDLHEVAKYIPKPFIAIWLRDDKVISHIEVDLEHTLDTSQLVDMMAQTVHHVVSAIVQVNKNTSRTAATLLLLSDIHIRLWQRATQEGVDSSSDQP